MTLEEATRQALDAADSGDLDALEHALEARAQAIAGGEEPDAGTLASGEQIRGLLLGFITRLRRISSGFAPDVSDPRMDYRG